MWKKNTKSSIFSKIIDFFGPRKMMEVPQKIEDFYGVYLLCSQSPDPKYKNRVYIGFTVNPNRRITQHNRGKDFGGARKTNNKGPWKMVLIVHGFPNNISALQFEWAWHWPTKSSRLKVIPDLWKKRRNETHFEFNFRILTEMLRTGPWNRLPLIVRWLAPDYVRDFPPDRAPPLHMQICHGWVVIKKKPRLPATDLEHWGDHMQRRPLECLLCMKIIEEPQRSRVTCVNPKCKLICHVVCLGSLCLEPGHYVPIEGECPICETHFLWGDLVRKKNGCNDLEEVDGDGICAEFLDDFEPEGDDNDDDDDEGGD